MNVALIGYGEVGRILAEDLRAAGHGVAAYDLKLDQLEAKGNPTAGASMRAHARTHGVKLAASPVAAVEAAELVISAVTASQTMAAAEACAGALAAGTFFLDLNSASPNTKIKAGHTIYSAPGRGRYVEAAVMTSVPPYRLKVPLLLGGPDAAGVQPLLESLGFSAKVASPKLGVASATKMCRSVMIKGLEAMVIESLTAARHYGVEDAVIGSLRETFPGIDWEKQATYFFQRVIEHGRRRGEEMREAAVAVRDAALEPWSASATADRQTWMADLADGGVFGARDGSGFARSADWRSEADRILHHTRTGRAGRT